MTKADNVAKETDSKTDESKTRQASVYLLHLMRCALNDLEAEPKPEEVEWEQVYKLAARNSVQGLTWFGAKTRDDMPADLRSTWEASANKVLYKHAMFDMEREAILKEMADRGLSYLPLKGLRIMPYYPRPEMRSFCDNDILYGYIEPSPKGGYRICGLTEAEQEKAVQRGIDDLNAIMKKMGYETKSSQVGVETYLKKPFYNFEMHRRLMPSKSNLYRYYESPWKRAIRDEGSVSSYHFSDEDEYIYMIAHAYKHFDYAGCGVRVLADIYVFLCAKKDLLDWSRVDCELDELDIAEFERQVRELALGGLAPNMMAELMPQQQDLLFYMVGSGAYGTVQQRIVNSISKSIESDASATAKARYLWQRLVGNEEFIKENHPFFYKYKVLRGFFLLYRLGRALVHNQKSTWHEIKSLMGSDKPK